MKLYMKRRKTDFVSNCIFFYTFSVGYLICMLYLQFCIFIYHYFKIYIKDLWVYTCFISSNITIYFIISYIFIRIYIHIYTYIHKNIYLYIYINIYTLDSLDSVLRFFKFDKNKNNYHIFYASFYIWALKCL